MSQIVNVKTGEIMEFSANEKLDAARANVAEGKDMAYVGLYENVLGNKQGKIKTAGEESMRATGGSIGAGFGSTYSVADTTIPFEYDWAKGKQAEIGNCIAQIQNKASSNISAIQGNLTKEQEKVLRESSKRSQAIREAKDEIRARSDSEFDQKVFNTANSSVRAGVFSDMSLTSSVGCSFAIMGTSEHAQWARDKGFKKVDGKDIWTTRADEKGLKKVSLIDADSVTRAKGYVFDVGVMISDVVDKHLTGPWSNEVSMAILKEIADRFPGKVDGDIKVIEDYNAKELAEIADMKALIIKEYDRIINEL